MDRKYFFDFVYKEFKVKPEYLWDAFPNYAVLRHSENNKWFAVIMDINASKIGLTGDKKIDLIDVKIHPEHAGSLRKNKGILPAYHMNKEHWVSIILESVDKETIYSLVKESYDITK